MKKKKRILFIIIPAVTLLITASISLILIFNNNKKQENNKTTQNEITEKENNTDEPLRISPVDDEIEEEAKENIKNNSTESSNKNTNSNTNKKDDATTKKDDNSIITVKPNSNSTSKRYKCSSGYTLEGNMCYKYEKPIIEYVCPLGATESGAYCIINTSTYANVSYSCNSGYTLSGNKCYKEKIVNSFNPANFSNYSETSKNQMYNAFVNACSNGKIKNENGIFYCYETETIYASATYSCPSGSGELAGDKCISAKIEEAFAKYSCKDGYFDAIEKKCVISKKAEKQ